MRIMWTLTISPTVFANLSILKYSKTFLAAVEIYRRGQWIFFRIENEQLNNIGEFRVLADVPLPITNSGPWNNPFFGTESYTDLSVKCNK